MQNIDKCLATDNIRLVYYMFNKLAKTELVNRYKDDLISEGMIGLVKASKGFDESRDIKFISYASRCIYNQMLMYIRKLRKHVGIEVSLNKPVYIDDNGNELCYADIIEASQINYEERMLIKAQLKNEKPRNRYIYVKYLSGYSQKDIATEMNLSQSYVSRIVRATMNKLRDSCGYSLPTRKSIVQPK